jgi:hypothetical protein
MNVSEVGKLQLLDSQSEAPALSVSRSNDRSEIVAAIRAAAREGGLPEGFTTVPSGNSELQIAFDRESKQYVVKILDRATQEVVRQIPAEDVLSRARFFVQAKQSADQAEIRVGAGIAVARRISD